MEVDVARKILDTNDAHARQNRERFAAAGVFVLNMMSSPGSGKTTLLEKTLVRIMPEIRCGVIVGDICTTNDADRLARSGAPVTQVNTDAFGGDCHLAAHVIGKAADKFDLENLDLLIVENIGNLVCPAEFDIGENAGTVVLSVTEGEDKPVKYPQMFRRCDSAVLNKTDLLPYLDFDIAAAEDFIRQVHSEMPIFQLSAKTEEGLEPWLNWLKAQVRKSRSAEDM